MEPEPIDVELLMDNARRDLPWPGYKVLDAGRVMAVIDAEYAREMQNIRAINWWNNAQPKEPRP